MADPTTQSNYLKIASKHITFDWKLDFDKCIVAGSAVHDLIVKEDGVKEVIFDTGDLSIESAEVAGKSVVYDIKPKHKVMGSALHIPLPSNLESGASISVKVTYSTSTGSTALQWLDKKQTKGKAFPFLFSQCQSIYCRTLAPVQDTPSVKATYNAKVTSVLPTLISAIRKSPPSDGPPHDGKVIGKDLVTYEYDQPVPIPSYLIAIAAGNLVYREFPKIEGKDWTCGVWAEPETIDASYYEFSEDTGRFLAKEEEIVIPYKFGVYDLLVLPPSFPYGGMENACLTFLTPTLLTGDRALVDVVVHELTHSWFGNGVTNTEATHFWLNEGWTTYMERLLQQYLHTPAHRGFAYIIGYKDLTDTLQGYANRPKYQRLVIEFDVGEDPEDAYSVIPYEKGSNFILYIERTLGGLGVFLPYIRDYVATYIGKSITTEQWKSHLYGYYQQHNPEKIKALDSIDWNAWFFGEGLELPVKMEYDSTLAEQAYVLAKRWDSARDTDLSRLDFKDTDIKDFTANQILVFLDSLQSYPALPFAHISHLGGLYRVSTSSNAEIRFRFYQVALLDPKSAAAKSLAPNAAKWIAGGDGTGVIGRMKFCRPIFKAVHKVDPDLAVSVYTRERDAFHPIARKNIEKDLGITST